MFSACNVYNKSFGCNFTIYDLCAQKRSGLLLSSDDFWKLSPCQLDKKVLSAFSPFLRPKTKLFAVKFRCILEVLCLQSLQRKVPGAMSRYMCPVTKWFSVMFRHILEVFALQGLQKKFSAHFLDFCIQKRSCLLRSSDTFLTFLPCMLCKKCSGRIFTIYVSKTKLFAMKFRRILEVLCLQVLKKKFWAQFHDLLSSTWH